MKRSLSLLAVMLLTLAMLPGVATGSDGLDVTDLTDLDLEAADLAEALVGEGVTIDATSVAYTGDDQAAGEFSGGTGIIGFEEGIILSSGKAEDVVGPNEAPSTTTAFGTPGDDDLTALSGFPTFDAAILEFEFEAEEGAEQVFFQYVFGSEEYNEYVDTQFNDVFAFWVNDVNCALVPDPDNGDLPVSINTINNGVTDGAQGQTTDPTNPDLYINNDPFNPDITGSTVPEEDLLDTEMDGLTVVLTCEADVEEGTNSMRLAIADAGDQVLDSWVLIEAGSLTTTPPEPELECVDLIADGGDNPTVVGEVCVENDDDYVHVTYATDGDWTLLETHLAVSTDAPGGDDWTDNRWQNRRGNPAPGQFPYSATHNPESDTTVDYSISLDELGAEPGYELFIGAHAVVTDEFDEETQEWITETAWGDGDRFVDRGNWATYFSYEVR